MEPKWLGMGECVIFRTLELEFLGRTLQGVVPSRSHTELYIGI